MTKDERIAIIAVCAKIEAVADKLELVYEIMQKELNKQAEPVFEQISSLHNIIGDILKIDAEHNKFLL